MPHFHFFIDFCSARGGLLPLYHKRGEGDKEGARAGPPIIMVGMRVDGTPLADPALFPRILAFLGEDPLVFHNAPFDLSFLRMEARLAGGEWPGNPVIDMLLLARRTRLFRDHSLSAICGRLGIGSAFHRAEGDAYAAGKLLLALAAGGGGCAGVAGGGGGV